MNVDRDLLARNNRQISIQLEHLANRRMAQNGLSAMQAHTLLYILHHSEEGTSLTAIHQKFGYSMATLSTLVKRLREKGYVQVSPCQGDDRRKILSGTQKGEQMQERLRGVLADIHSQLYDGFSEGELQELDRLQKKMLQNLSRFTKNGSQEESVS